MAIAQTGAERTYITGRVRTFDQQKIVAARRRLGERDSYVLLLRSAHSCSVVPSDVTLPNTLDSCNRMENTLCDSCSQSTAKTMRKSGSADAMCTLCMVSCSASRRRFTSRNIPSTLRPVTSYVVI